MPKDMIESLLTILGRDQLYYEVKHEDVYEFIEPFCQVLIVSNKSPDQFPLIWERTELREKITSLKFVYPIPQHLMIANLKNNLEKLSIAFFIWAMFTPRFFLLQQTRGRLLKAYIEATANTNKTNLHYFIEEVLCVHNYNSKDIYVTKDELRNRFEEWAVKNGTLSYIKDKNKFLMYLPRNLTNILESEYQVLTEEKRPVINKTRVLAIYGIAFRPDSFEGSEFKPIEAQKHEMFDFGDLDPLYDVREIEVFSLQLEGFNKIQEKILMERRK